MSAQKLDALLEDSDSDDDAPAAAPQVQVAATYVPQQAATCAAFVSFEVEKRLEE